MTNSNTEKGLTRKQLVLATGCKPFLVDYCRSCGYLPILREAAGPGIPVLYDPESIPIIKDRMAKHTHPGEDHGRDKDS